MVGDEGTRSMVVYLNDGKGNRLLVFQISDKFPDALRILKLAI